jgi:hypothetical protein
MFVQYMGKNSAMNSRVKQACSMLAVLTITLLCASYLPAQDSRAAVSGTITDSSGKGVSDAQITVKNLSTGEFLKAETDSSGHYNFSNLPAGDCDVSVVSESGSASQKVSLTPGTQQTLNLTLTQAQTPAAASPQTLPNAPTPDKTEPSLEDLGFSKSETQANAREQALLDKRTHMLKIHQRMGLITTIPMIASVVTSLNAGGRSEGTASRDLHVALGALTGDLYGITAYYAIRAPRIKGTKKRGPIKFHEAMAWIHGPGMIATPILGAIAFSQKNNGEKVHGIAQAHGPVAIVTAGAFGAALLSVSFKF